MASASTCEFGTAFGYHNPVAGLNMSFQLNLQSGVGRNGGCSLTQWAA